MLKWRDGTAGMPGRLRAEVCNLAWRTAIICTKLAT